jgi:hypothetical protein
MNWTREVKRYAYLVVKTLDILLDRVNELRLVFLDGTSDLLAWVCKATVDRAVGGQVSPLVSQTAR